MQKTVHRLPLRGIKAYVYTFSSLRRPMLMILIILLSLQAYSQQVLSKKLSISIQNVTPRKALEEIQKAGGIRILFGEDINRFSSNKVSINQKDITIQQALTITLKKTTLTYELMDNYILIKETKSATAPKATLAAVKQAGSISGKIIDSRGNPLVGASLQVMQKGGNAQSSVDGSYQITLTPGQYTIEVTYVGFQTKRITDIKISEKENTPLNIVMADDAQNLQTVVVTSSYQKASVEGLYARQKSSASTTDGITAEQIARTPDNNVAQVLGRVSGLNIQDGKHVTVRGLSDRYNNVLLNGSQLPSTEPNKRNFAFDIIPSSMIDNVIVHKTATANLSGEFSGGIVEVETRSIPTENFFSIKLGTGINTAATGKDFYQPQRGKYDFLAIDDNRKIGKGFNNNEYATLTFANNAADNEKRNEMMALFPNRFKMYNYKGAPLQDYGINAGKVVSFDNGNRLGVVAGITYRNQQTATEYTDQLELARFFRFEGKEYEFSTNWSAMLNAGYSFGNHKIGIKNIYSRRLTEQSYLYRGKDLYNGFFVDGIANTPLINSIMQNRIEGEHKIGTKGPILKWHASASRTQRDEPDNKNHVGYSEDSVLYRYVWVQDALTFSSNFFSTFRENRYTWAAETDIPLRFWNRKQLIKTGYQGSYRDASFEAEIYAIKGNNTHFAGLPYYEAFARENFKANQLYYVPYLTNPALGVGKTNGYDGFQRLNAGYIMFDGKPMAALRVIAGLRMEHNITANRSSAVSYVGDNPVRTDSLVQIDKIDWLPSATLIYSLSPKTNIRASYFASVARPDLRELSFFTYFEAQRRTYVTGKDLKPTSIHNADIRFEHYPSPGEIISVSGFYKHFINPIELQMRDLSGGGAQVAEMYYMNLDQATNIGFEVNFRKSLAMFNETSSLLNNLFVSGNFTWMHSKLTLEGKEDIYQNLEGGKKLLIPAQQSRPLWGQAPYLINGGLLYTGEHLGINLSYTRVGERIIYGAQSAHFNEWEKARDVLDLQFSYRFGTNNRAEIKLNIADLLNQAVIRYFNDTKHYYAIIGTLPGEAVEPDREGIIRMPENSRKYNEKDDELRRKFKYGRNISLSLTYNF